VTGKEALPAKPVPQGRTVQLIVNATCAGAPAPANFAGVRNMAVAVLEGAGFKVVDSAAERADREFTIAVRGTPIDVLVSKQAGGPPKTRREPGEKPNYLGAIVEGEVAGEKYRGTHNFAKMIDGRYTNPFGLELTDPMDAPYEATLWGSVVRETDYLWVLTHQAAKMSGMGRAWILVSVMSKHPELLPKETVRSMIIVAGKDPKTANDTVAALADALSSESAVIRAFAAGALQYCPEAGKASAALARALQDKDEKVRHEAAMALRSLSHSSGAAAPSSIPALTEALASGYPDARREAALALGSMGMQAKEAIPALAKAMDDEFFSVQMEAIRALGAMAREDASARTALSDALRSKKADVRRLAGDELSKLGGTGKSSGDKGSDRAGAEILAALTTALADANPATRKSAAESLERMGEKAKDAVPALTKALQDDDWDVRQKAVKALERVGPLAKSAVPALCALLSESANAGQKGIIGIYIVNAVTRIAPDDSAVHDALIKALANHQTEATREYAAGALGDIRAPISVSVPALVTALNDPKLNVTLRAARSLGKLGPAAKDAIPALTQALNHHFYETCGCAAMALGNIGPAAKSAIPALRALAEKYKGKNVGEAAEKAIREIEK
jgi:HEAT repeat protein